MSKTLHKKLTNNLRTMMLSETLHKKIKIEQIELNYQKTVLTRCSVRVNNSRKKTDPSTFCCTYLFKLFPSRIYICLNTVHWTLSRDKYITRHVAHFAKHLFQQTVFNLSSGNVSLGQNTFNDFLQRLHISDFAFICLSCMV